jgi:uncharacterized damage-inducible protein DinB
MTSEFMADLSRYQAWADAAYWEVIRANAALREDAEIRKRLGHMVTAMKMLCARARGESPDPAALKMDESVSSDEVEVAMRQAQNDLTATLGSVDLDKQISLPRGPKGPFEAPAGVLILQALLHGQHHRGQNAARIRQLGATPPMTDIIIWYALGRP